MMIEGRTEEWALPLLDARELSFTPMWRQVSDACSDVFAALETRPRGDLASAYRALLASMCKAHALVYRLVTYKCAECPSLVRGTRSERVVGDKQESTQVLVVYYLLREMLKKKLAVVKATIEQASDDDVAAVFVDAFDKYTAGVNLIASAFVYLHWGWQRRGLPAEHIILPTEVVSLHLLIEHALDANARARLTAYVCRTASAVRSHNSASGGFSEALVAAMETCKLLALRVSLMHENRQCLYITLVEEPYVAALVTHYEAWKATYKQQQQQQQREGDDKDAAAAAYVLQCHRAVLREEVRAHYFLYPSSYKRVRARLIELFVDTELAYLTAPVTRWLTVGDGDDAAALTLTQRKALVALHELLDVDTQRGWVHAALHDIVVGAATRAATAALSASTTHATHNVLAALRGVYTRQRTLLERVFGAQSSTSLLLRAVLGGLGDALAALEASDGTASATPPHARVDAASVAVALAEATAEEMCTLAHAHTPPTPTCDVAVACMWAVDVFDVLTRKDAFFARYLQLLEARLMRCVLHDRHADAMQVAQQGEAALLDALAARHRDSEFLFRSRRMLRDVYATATAAEELPAAAVTADEALRVWPVVLSRFVWPEAVALTAASATEMASLPLPLRTRLREAASQHMASTHGAGHRLTFLPAVSSVRVRVQLPRTPQHGAATVTLHLLLTCRQCVLLLTVAERGVCDMEELRTHAGLATVAQVTSALAPLLRADVVRLVDATSPQQQQQQQQRVQLGALSQLPLGATTNLMPATMSDMAGERAHAAVDGARRGVAAAAAASAGAAATGETATSHAMALASTTMTMTTSATAAASSHTVASGGAAGGSRSAQMRDLALEATIVRCVKSATSCRLDDIVREVSARQRTLPTSTSATTTTPTHTDVLRRDVKSAIDRLISRGYVQRNMNDNTFSYLS